MNYTPRIDRRSFLVGSAAMGLSLGFHVPFATSAGAKDSPEINAWVVIEPDDTVIIRIARSEMGQGTLTGLAQMVAEELGLVEGHHRIPDTRPKHCAQKSVGRFQHRRQPRYPLLARVRAQGRRGGAHDAHCGRSR